MNDKEIQLQRLVDSQLNLEQTLELLRLAEQDPALWRDIAAAFVEDQMWRAEITADGQSNLLGAIDSDVSSKRTRSAAKSNSSSVNSFKFLMALAAAVFIGLWLGSVWNSQGKPTGDAVIPVVNNDIKPEAVSPENSDPQSPSPQLVSNFEPAHHLSMGEAGDVPLFTLDQAREMGFLKEQPLPQETVERLRERGYQLEQNTQYISGKAQDGRRVLVPVRSVSLSRGN